MRKVIVVILVVAVAGLVLGRYFTAEAKARRGGQANKALAVETEQAHRRTLMDFGEFTGSLEALERFEVAPKVGGILREIRADLGDHVKRGDLLAVLDDEEYALAAEQAKANLAVTEATSEDAKRQMEIAKRDHARTAALLESKVTTVAEFDKVDAAYKAKEALYQTTLAQASALRSALQIAEVKRGYTRITADWPSGSSDSRVVGDRYVNPGALLQPNAPILSLLDINSLYAVIHVTERDYAKIKPGETATLETDAYPGRVFSGRVERIAQELDANTRVATVKIDFPNPEGILRPGMFVRVRIEYQKRENVVALPITAIVRREAGRGVFVVDKDKAGFVPVKEGIVDGGWVEAIDPVPELLSGQVVVMGQHMLQDGGMVHITK